MIFGEQRFTLDRIVRLSLGVAVFVAVVALTSMLSDVLVPFAVALLLAYLINPLVTLLQRKIPHRGVAVALALVAIVLVFVVAAVILLPVIFHEMRHAVVLVKQLVTQSDLAKNAAQRLPPDLWQALQDLMHRPELSDFVSEEKLAALAQHIGGRILPGVWGLLSGTANLMLALVGGFVILLYVVFLLLDYQQVSGSWQELIPAPYREMLMGLVDDFHQAMRRYFRAQAIVAGLTGLICALGFALVGLPLGILLGLFVGLLNMVPYLQLIALVPAALLALVHALETGMGFGTVLALTGLVFVVAQVIQDGILVPRIMGDVTGLSPAVIMLSLSIWGKLLGLLGLIIALPVTFLLLAYYKNFLRQSSATAAGHDPPAARGDAEKSQAQAPGSVEKKASGKRKKK